MDLAYDGRDFSGWAKQPQLRTVQGELEKWLCRIFATEISLTVAGRTDAGVHASGQVAHFDTPDDALDLARSRFHNSQDQKCSTDQTIAKLVSRLNRVLPNDIVLHRLSVAPADFDARFAAIWRRYCYRIWDADSNPNPLYRFNVAQISRSLDLDLVNELGSNWLGLADFGAFCKFREGASTIRTLQVCQATRLDDPHRTVGIEVKADAFCHSMVRSLVGALVSVGTGQKPLSWGKSLVGQPSRNSAIYVMPAAGLTLEEVGYPTPSEYAERISQAQQVRTIADIEAANQFVDSAEGSR